MQLNEKEVEKYLEEKEFKQSIIFAKMH